MRNNWWIMNSPTVFLHDKATCRFKFTLSGLDDDDNNDNDQKTKLEDPFCLFC